MLCVLNQYKKAEKRLISHNFTQNAKNGPDNIIGTFSKFWVNNIVPGRHGSAVISAVHSKKIQGSSP